MNQQPVWRRYLRLLGPDVRADVDDELRFHLEMGTEELEGELATQRQRIETGLAALCLGGGDAVALSVRRIG